MAATLPRISIVTPSFNQASYIAETLDSLLAQEYPQLEVIVQDGGSTDGALEIAQRYATEHPEVFRVYSEKDRGQAHALNLGFARTTGQILGFLNSDDTLLPGTLHRVAAELAPETGHQVVVGRCIFTGEEGAPYVGLEHPSEWKSQFEHLAVWKRGYNTIPQPSVFWTRRVWEECGGLDETESHALDYDLFCRFGARYPFHPVDALWSTYRMHPASKSSQKTEAEVLALTIGVSRKHWGPWWSPLRWRLQSSFRWYDPTRHEAARRHARTAETAFKEGQHGRAVAAFCRTAWQSPRLAWQRLLAPRLSSPVVSLLERVLFSGQQAAPAFTGRHGDGWIGPVFREQIEVPPNPATLQLVFEHRPPPGHPPQLEVEVALDGRTVLRHQQPAPGQFALQLPLEAWAGKRADLTLTSRPEFVPQQIDGSADARVLAVQLLEHRVVVASPQVAP